jgi:GGDEF domain-containing protein
MGVIELQVFVSLVVILGAAFVALICDFLKGNNEQLRESNIVLRVREDERTRREELVERVQERVQRQTLEVLTQVQRVSGQRPVVAAKPTAAKSPVEQPVATAAPAAPAVASDPVESAGRGYAERSGRVRRQRPAPAAPEVNAPIPVRTDADATWAQDIILRRHPQAEIKPEPEAQTQPQPQPQPQAQPEPARTVPAPQFEAFDIRQAAPSRVVVTQSALTPAESPAPAMVSTQQPIQVVPLAGQIRAAALAATPQPAEFGPSIPVSDARPELSIEIIPDAVLMQDPEPAIDWAEDQTAPDAPMILEAPAPEMAAATEIPLSAVAQSAGDPIWSGLPMVQEAVASVPSADSQVFTPLTPQMAATAESAQLPVAMRANQADSVPGAFAPAEVQSIVPTLQLQAEPSVFEIAEPVAEQHVASADPQADEPIQSQEIEEAQVVRVRVLRDDEDLNNQEAQPKDEEAVAGILQEAAAGTQTELEPVEPELVAAAEPVLAEAFAAFDSNIAIEDPFPSLEEILAPATLELEPWLNESPQETAAPVEARSNVVQMPVSALRPQEPEKTTVGELSIPGGFHEATSLARLMEDERPFHGLVLAISVVDHVRLLADQGKPATEQLMASVTRLVVSMAREQDFVCRIGEDEFILIFSRETGAAAKRRIQLVSERLWDFQLRSLGSVSVIFSWGATESQAQPLMQAVENAREQMIDTRRNRRAYNTGANRFNRRAAN